MNRIFIYSGDGDDEVHMGNNWHFGYGFLGDGNDVYYTGRPNRNMVDAGPGDDKIFSVPYDEIDPTLEDMDRETVWGGPGNDLIYGSHKVLNND